MCGMQALELEQARKWKKNTTSGSRVPREEVTPSSYGPQPLPICRAKNSQGFNSSPPPNEEVQCNHKMVSGGTASRQLELEAKSWSCRATQGWYCAIKGARRQDALGPKCFKLTLHLHITLRVNRGSLLALQGRGNSSLDNMETKRLQVLFIQVTHWNIKV